MLERVVEVVVLRGVRGKQSLEGYGLVDFSIARSTGLDTKTVRRAIRRDDLGTATEMRMDGKPLSAWWRSPAALLATRASMPPYRMASAVGRGQIRSS